MSVITPVEGTFKRSEVLARAKAEPSGLGVLFWIGAAITGTSLLVLGFLWILPL